MRAQARHAHLPALALLLLALTLPWRGAAWAQVSPGPLSTPHAAIDATTQCFQCHASGGSKQGMDARCLACHKEVAWMKTNKRGFHAVSANKECSSCHPDHGGRTFALIEWDGGSFEKFDHKRAGYTLEGKHASLACRDCHKPALQKSPAVPLMKKKDHAASFLGLETACASCHADPHRGQLGSTCTSCHGQQAWKPAPGFDHAKSAFPLTGEHTKVECAKCHAAPGVAKGVDDKGRPIAQWKPLKHADCVACHKDPHAGRFTGGCVKCHTTAGWKSINKTGFNHDLTRYPLRGRHAGVACNSCHDPKKGGEKPKFARCMDCHADPHAGKATLASQVVDCASCHTLDGFERPAYTVAQHAQSRFPLLGGHATANCVTCHAKLPASAAATAAWGSARVVIRPAFNRCNSCHADPHRGRFEATGARPHKSGCVECHGMDTFHPSKYDGAAHASCVFPLDGAHRAVACQSCHEELKAKPTEFSLLADSTRVRALRFDNPRRACVDCHKSPHGDQFAHRKDKGACEGCHDAQAFVPASRFDHDRDARYKLVGAHRTTPCAKCHVPKSLASGETRVTYRPLESRCQSCHATDMRDSSLTAPRGSSFFVPERRSALRLALLTTREVNREAVR